jgi:hypothetical protein
MAAGLFDTQAQLPIGQNAAIIVRIHPSVGPTSLGKGFTISPPVRLQESMHESGVE